MLAVANPSWPHAPLAEGPCAPCLCSTMAAGSVVSGPRWCLASYTSKPHHLGVSSTALLSLSVKWGNNYIYLLAFWDANKVITGSAGECHVVSSIKGALKRSLSTPPFLPPPTTNAAADASTSPNAPTAIFFQQVFSEIGFPSYGGAGGVWGHTGGQIYFLCPFGRASTPKFGPNVL